MQLSRRTVYIIHDDQDVHMTVDVGEKGEYICSLNLEVKQKDLKVLKDRLQLLWSELSTLEGLQTQEALPKSVETLLETTKTDKKSPKKQKKGKKK